MVGNLHISCRDAMIAFVQWADLLWGHAYSQADFQRLEDRRVSWEEAYCRSSFKESIGEVCLHGSTQDGE